MAILVVRQFDGKKIKLIQKNIVKKLSSYIPRMKHKKKGNILFVHVAVTSSVLSMLVLYFFALIFFSPFFS